MIGVLRYFRFYVRKNVDTTARFWVETEVAE